MCFHGRHSGFPCHLIQFILKQKKSLENQVDLRRWKRKIFSWKFLWLTGFINFVNAWVLKKPFLITIKIIIFTIITIVINTIAIITITIIILIMQWKIWVGESAACLVAHHQYPIQSSPLSASSSSLSSSPSSSFLIITFVNVAKLQNSVNFGFWLFFEWQFSGKTQKFGKSTEKIQLSASRTIR